MKSIPLRTVGDFVYADAIRLVVRQPLDKQAGVGIEEMRRGIRILDKLDAAGEVLALEDADYDHLVAKLRVMSWGMVDRDLLAFIDTVLEAPEHTTNGTVIA